MKRERASVQRLQAGLTALLLLLSPFALSLLPLPSVRAEPAAPAVHAVDAVGMTVADLERSVTFFSEVLSFKKISEVEVSGTEYEHLEGVFGLRMKVARLKLGDEVIELTEYMVPKGRPMPVDSRSNDQWFQHIAIVVRDMEEAYQHLRKHKVRHVSMAPQRIPDWNAAAAGVKAFYFRDPDGHNLELIFFPPDKGDPKWQRPTDMLFLGIDHTAIAVSDTEASLKFYRDLLGLEVMGESLNYGTEQEQLANVFGARVHITAIRSLGGAPGIEFLDYLTPADGRPMPDDLRANDIMHWQTILVVKDVNQTAERLRAAKATWISPGVVTFSDGALGFNKGLLVRDPDGHALGLVEK